MRRWLERVGRLLVAMAALIRTLAVRRLLEELSGKRVRWDSRARLV
jgi:hypothetical protein